MSRKRAVRVFAVDQGAPGGGGRVEVLMENAWREMEHAGQIELKVLHKSTRPDYLQGPPGSVAGGALRMALAYAATVVTWRPDIVVFGHVNLTPLSLVSPVQLRRVCVVYGIDAWRPLANLRRHALRRMDRIWAISRYTGEAAHTAQGLDYRRLRQVPPALEDHRMAQLSLIPAPPRGESTRFLTVTRLDATQAYKGVDTVLESFARLTNRGLGATLTVAGNGSDLERLRAKAAGLGLSSRVRWETQFSDQRLVELLAESHVFVLPSHDEGFGLVYLEAMAAGRPVIAADAAATPELVKSGQTGVLIPPGNVESLEQHMAELLCKPSVAQAMGARGRAEALDQYREKRFRERLNVLLDDALAGS